MRRIYSIRRIFYNLHLKITIYKLQINILSYIELQIQRNSFQRFGIKISCSSLSYLSILFFTVAKSSIDSVILKHSSGII